MVDAIETNLSETSAETIRVPRNIMGLLRQSYDTRERVLDWMLALFVAGALVLMFRDQIWACFIGDPSANAGRDDEPIPSQDINSAIPPQNSTVAKLYTYNMPSSRSIKFRAGPSMTPPPSDPSQPPLFP